MTRGRAVAAAAVRRLSAMADGGATTTAAERAAAAAMREGSGGGGGGSGGGGSGGAGLFESLPGCQIDENCKQKYVLIELAKGGAVRHLVRGSRLAAYHKDAAEPTLAALREGGEDGLAYKVLGGGRIMHLPEAKRVEVFGFSYGFPWEGAFRHDLSAAVVSEAYPGWQVTTSDEGY